MLLKSFAALGCAVSAFALASAADAAMFSYQFNVDPIFDGATATTGMGTFTADDNGDGSFTVTNTDGSITIDGGTDTIVDSVSTDDYSSGVTLFASADASSYSFSGLQLIGVNNSYNFFHLDADTLLGPAGGEASGLATFTITRTDAVSSDVPEAATWAMMVAGFGLTGAAMRRRKTAVSFA